MACLPSYPRREPRTADDKVKMSDTEGRERAVVGVRKILVMGLPGAGKTTLAEALVRRLNAVHFNADDIRANINRDLGFSPEDRIEQARRMGWLCDRVTATGNYAVADFVCPTPDTRAAFAAHAPAFTVWLDRIAQGRFEDTNRLFTPPDRYDIRVPAEGTPEYWTEQVAAAVRPVFDDKRPTALFVGRYQPFHDGHKALIEEGIRRVGQACVAVRDTGGTDASNPFAFEYVRSRIELSLRAHQGRFVIVPLPNISHIFFGRDVGYAIERLELDKELEMVSATSVRSTMFGTE